MFKNAIRGLDQILETDIPAGSLILVTGAPGTMKSGFIHSMMTGYLSQKKEFGLYVSLEEPKASHNSNIKSLGIKPYPGLEIFDYQDIRRDYGLSEEHDLDTMEGIQNIIKFYKDKEKDRFSCFALDSLNAMYSLMPVQNLRARMYRFFDILRLHKLTSFIIFEVPREGIQDIYGGEGFLADGIINMGTMKASGDITIFTQIEKMRSTKHSRKKFQVGVDENGLIILGSEYE